MNAGGERPGPGRDLMKDEMRAIFAARAREAHEGSLLVRARRQVAAARRAARSLPGRTERRRSGIALEYLAGLAAASGEPAVARPCLVGTFHKTGTMLMLAFLGEFAAHARTGLWNMGLGPPPEGGWRIGFDWWGDFADHGADPAAHPTVLLVRDPRDVLVSSMRFHRRSAEPWLHVPRAELGGRTYQQASHACASDEERYRFELAHQAGATIRDMLAARRDPAHRDTLFLPMEDLMSDPSMGGYRRMFAHLGLSPSHEPLALAAAFRNSVFNPAFRRTRHVTSGRREVWRDALPASVLGELDELFPGAAAELGYPP